ncbi:hypothetical protein BDC45DRAFT_535280 [Circinella umbellata]|nr:hypothetical protein BDC45DRAFT_535280 [Circinella umbellata]
MYGYVNNTWFFCLLLLIMVVKVYVAKSTLSYIEATFFKTRYESIDVESVFFTSNCILKKQNCEIRLQSGKTNKNIELWVCYISVQSSVSLVKEVPTNKEGYIIGYEGVGQEGYKETGKCRCGQGSLLGSIYESSSITKKGASEKEHGYERVVWDIRLPISFQ